MLGAPLLLFVNHRKLFKDKDLILFSVSQDLALVLHIVDIQ